MKYNKPEIAVLGDASVVIRGKMSGSQDNGVQHTVASSYDLDEE